MTTTININGQGASLALTILDYERPESQNYDDANWLSAILDVNVNPFAVSFPLSITTKELRTFSSQLEEMSKEGDTAELGNAEEEILCKYQMGAYGKITLSGEIKPNPGVSLSFEAECDQSFVRLTLQDLAEALRLYPVRLIER